MLGAQGHVEPPCGCWESNLDPLQQQSLLNTEPSFFLKRKKYFIFNYVRVVCSHGSGFPQNPYVFDPLERELQAVELPDVGAMCPLTTWSHL